MTQVRGGESERQVLHRKGIIALQEVNSTPPTLLLFSPFPNKIPVSPRSLPHSPLTSHRRPRPPPAGDTRRRRRSSNVSKAPQVRRFPPLLSSRACPSSKRYDLFSFVLQETDIGALFSITDLPSLPPPMIPPLLKGA